MTDKQIIIKEITECGFYCAKEDLERLYIYEVIKNTDEEWLKETPEQTLLIDEWIYDYTDYDDRKVYTTSGNLVAVCNDSATCKVYKIEDTKYKIYGNNGLFLIEDKPTYKEQLKAKEQECGVLEEKLERQKDYTVSYKSYVYEKEKQFKQQLEAYKMEAEEGKEINAELKAENESLENQLKSEKERFEKQDKFAAMYIQELKNEKSSLIMKSLDKIGQFKTENYKLKQTLTEIKEIAEKSYRTPLAEKDCIICDDFLGRILQKISEVIND